VRPLSTVIALLIAASIRTAADPVIGFLDDFETVEAWKANNPRTPPEFSTDGDVLTLTDPPGGEVTWGTSIYRDIGVIDLDQTPYLLAELVGGTGGFSVTLINRDTNDKQGGVIRANPPGFAVCHVPSATRWSGKVPISMGLYVQGTEKTIQVNWVKFVSELTAQEEKALPAPPPQEVQGLFAAAKRQGWRKLPLFRRGDTYLSERLVFRDTVTGNQVWRMTCDPGVDKVQYYDLPEWNADGSRLIFDTRREPTGLWQMDADGGNLRPLPIEGASSFRGFLSIKDPGIFYLSRTDESGTYVDAWNITTGERQEVAHCSVPGLGMQPPHPSEEHFLLSKNGTADTDCVVVVVGRDGSEQVVPIGGRYHRLRFAKSPDRRIFFNRDDPRTQWAIMPDGSGLTALPDPGGHPDWTPDGAYLTYYSGGAIWQLSKDGQQKTPLLQHGGGGHGGSTLDGDFFVSDTGPGGDYPDSILYLRRDGSQVVQRVCSHGSDMLAHSPENAAHPDHHSAHPHPMSSPDGTKTVFGSHLLGPFTDVYVCVNRYPDPPRNLACQVQGRQARFAWEKPMRCRELKGYAVYHSPQSGVGYRQINRELARRTDYLIDNPKPGFYVVTAVEYSGLESRPSGEVSLGVEDAPRRLLLEAEAGQLELPVHEVLRDAECSNGYCVGSREAEGGGSVTLDVGIPVAGQYAVWARAQGEGEWRVSADGDSLGSLAASGEWAWRKLDEAVALSRGAHKIALAPSTGATRLDKLLITSDSAYTPEGRMRLREAPPPPVRGLRAEPIDSFTMHLTWEASADPGLAYYNVYSPDGPDEACSQATRIASVPETEFVDAARAPEQTLTYRVTAVDRSGNESAPSQPVTLETPARELVCLALEAEEGSAARGVVGANIEGASGGGCLAGDPGDGACRAAVELRFRVPQEDDYAVWARYRYPQPGGRGCTVQVDDREPQSWPMYGRFEQWVWGAVGPTVSTTPALWRLNAGEHTLRLRFQGEGKLLDLVVVTNDASTIPQRWGEPPEALKRFEPENAAAIEPAGRVLFTDDFTGALDNWYHEGGGRLAIERPGVMRVEIIGSQQGSVGCQALCRETFPDRIALEYDLKLLTKNGLLITFIAMAGLNGEDLIEGGLPPREGVFADYTGEDAVVKSYHVSVSRYDDQGQHTGVSNWRRNPGLHLMGQGEDRCREINRWYHVRIVKAGGHCQLQVNDRLAHQFTDPETLTTPMPTVGKIGFRAIGSNVQALVRNLRVVGLN